MRSFMLLAITATVIAALAMLGFSAFVQGSSVPTVRDAAYPAPPTNTPTTPFAAAHYLPMVLRGLTPTPTATNTPTATR